MSLLPLFQRLQDRVDDGELDEKWVKQALSHICEGQLPCLPIEGWPMTFSGKKRPLAIDRTSPARRQIEAVIARLDDRAKPIDAFVPPARPSSVASVSLASIDQTGFRLGKILAFAKGQGYSGADLYELVAFARRVLPETLSDDNDWLIFGSSVLDEMFFPYLWLPKAPERKWQLIVSNAGMRVTYPVPMYLLVKQTP